MDVQSIIQMFAQALGVNTQPTSKLPPLQEMMRGQQVMSGLYDPTGITFDHAGGGTSTELGGIYGGGGEPYQLIPTLVPGQKDIEGILSGRPGYQLTPEQVKIIIDYAKSRSSEVPTFSKLEDAEAYENKRHEGLQADYPPSRKNPQDLLAWLRAALPADIQR